MSVVMVLRPKSLAQRGSTLGSCLATDKPLLEQIAEGGLCRGVPPADPTTTVWQRARTQCAVGPGGRQQGAPRAQD